MIGKIANESEGKLTSRIGTSQDADRNEHKPGGGLKNSAESTGTLILELQRQEHQLCKERENRKSEK